jgi:nitrogen fixation protein NifB
MPEKYALIKKKHPCFSEKAHRVFARIHLPVARMCNIGCRYCLRKLDKVENRPGVASAIITPQQAVARVRQALKRYPITVVGIAGPGEPLANKETFLTLSLIKKEFPRLLLCVSSNGLLVADCIDFLRRVHLRTLTVTINAVSPATASKIYDFIIYQGKKYTGLAAAKILLAKQMTGVKAAVKAGICVKINTVLIPNINAGQITQIARQCADAGAEVMNIMPLLPIYRMAQEKIPGCVEIRRAREAAEKYLSQFRKCKQCRADAVGIPGLEKKGQAISTGYFHF